ncbi:hypothetical protein WJ970_00705 [Achromobacter xylosoxidans]
MIVVQRVVRDQAAVEVLAIAADGIGQGRLAAQRVEQHGLVAAVGVKGQGPGIAAVEGIQLLVPGRHRPAAAASIAPTLSSRVCVTSGRLAS